MTLVAPLSCPQCGGTSFGRRTCRACGAVPDWMSYYRALGSRLTEVRAAGEPEGDLVGRKLAAFWAMTPDERAYAESDRPLPPKRQSL
jgi:hypothetical protein